MNPDLPPSAREEPSPVTTDPAQQAGQVDPTTQASPESLYSAHDIQPRPQSTYTTIDPHNAPDVQSSLQTPTAPSSTYSPFQLQDNDTLISDLPAAEFDMAPTSSRRDARSQQQYQLMSSGTPADQARAMSQVSPGFIFVIFPMSSRLLLLRPNPPFPFLYPLFTSSLLLF